MIFLSKSFAENLRVKIGFRDKVFRITIDSEEQIETLYSLTDDYEVNISSAAVNNDNNNNNNINSNNKNSNSDYNNISKTKSFITNTPCFENM